MTVASEEAEARRSRSAFTDRQVTCAGETRAGASKYQHSHSTSRIATGPSHHGRGARGWDGRRSFPYRVPDSAPDWRQPAMHARRGNKRETSPRSYTSRRVSNTFMGEVEVLPRMEPAMLGTTDVPICARHTRKLKLKGTWHRRMSGWVYTPIKKGRSNSTWTMAARSHTRTVVSTPPVTRIEPSGDASTHVTMSCHIGQIQKVDTKRETARLCISSLFVCSVFTHLMLNDGEKGLPA